VSQTFSALATQRFAEISLRRVFRNSVTFHGGYDGPYTEERRCSEEEAEVVTSELEGGMHAPALDIDMPCELRPSKTLGHHHLLISKPMSWRKYRRLMKALWKAGVIEKGFYRMSVKKGYSSLRVPAKD
jgi:hypothetical protein